jgi:CO/xanthine dehydrogenase FAD-binding subunit
VANRTLTRGYPVGPGGPTPFRATEVEAILRRETFTDELLNCATEALLDQAKFRTSPRRATQEYRQHIVKGLFTDTFLTAWERAGYTLIEKLND